MDERLEAYFVKKYPNLFKDYGKDTKEANMRKGCTCGEGWFRILNRAFREIEREGVHLSQVTEKYGNLEISWYYSSKELSLHTSKEIQDLCYSAERESAHRCEVCGRGGGKKGMVCFQTLCSRCNSLSIEDLQQERDKCIKYIFEDLY